MARAESNMIMGYLPIEQRHDASLYLLVTPLTPSLRLVELFPVFAIHPSDEAGGSRSLHLFYGTNASSIAWESRYSR